MAWVWSQVLTGMSGMKGIILFLKIMNETDQLVFHLGIPLLIN